jgi:hypothetical protein
LHVQFPADMPLDIQFLVAIRALIEVAGLMLLVRGAIWLFAAKARQSFVYAIFTAGTLPFVRLARAITPREVRDFLMPLVAFFLLFCLWLALGVGKEWMCAVRALECA